MGVGGIFFLLEQLLHDVYVSENNKQNKKKKKVTEI